MLPCLQATQDEIFWQLNFTKTQRPFLAMLSSAAQDPMRPPPRPPGWDPEDEEGEEDEDEDEVPEVKVQQNGLSRRIIAVPVGAARMEKLSVLWDDVLIYTQLAARPEEGPRGVSEEEEEEEKGTMMR